ncbi:transposase [Endozoicomonas numazuensis]|uniref:Toxin RelE n=1 Tax=Endozoicomonas numazuensis TaxID=1137799 RepID=A0A081N163_9GAMM|nr:transposase [Endozoicomonas numazuensis]KEQ12186.1 toxin RelE [Endozoicomonas numazuensis]
MSRPLRLEYAGALYHVTSRGNERKPIFLEKKDFELFLEVLDEVCFRFNWVIHSWCLMTNHYHFLVETPDANLSAGMRQLNGVYTLRFNRRYGRVGHLFQGRYKGILVDKSSYLLELNRYIVLNPVRAGMVDNPEAWLWSSYLYTLGQMEAPSWLAVDQTLLLFSPNRKQACEHFIRFVAADSGIDVWQNLIHQIFLGNESFVAEQKLIIEELQLDLNEIPHKQTRPVCKSLDFYESSYSDRKHAMTAAYHSGGYTMSDIANHFGVHYSTVSRACTQCKN